MRSTPTSLLLAASLILTAWSCGGGGGGATGNPQLAIQLQVDPVSASLNTGESAIYVANVRIPGVGVNLYEDARFGIQWTATGGSLAPVQGQNIAWRTYTAPQTPGTYQVTLQSTYNPGTSITSTVTVARPPVATSLTAGSTSLVQGDQTTVTPVFSDGTGRLQPGNLTVQSGVPVTVTPLQTTQYSLVVTNSIGRTATQTVTVQVTAKGAFAPLPVWNPDGFTPQAEALLPDGKVLVVGTALPYNAAACTLDPATWQFTPTSGAPTYIHASPRTQVLADGRVLIYDTGAEVYAPATGAFTRVDTSTLGTDSCVAALSAGGSLLIAGFQGVAVFDPATLSLGTPVPYPSGFSLQAAVPYAGSRALFLNSNQSGSPYLFDAAAGTFTALAGAPYGLGLPTVAVQLPNGKIFLAGSPTYASGDNTRAYLLDPATGTFTAQTPLLAGRDESTEPAVLHDGRVLLSGLRLSAGPTELFDPALGLSCQLPNLDSLVGRSHATVLADGRVLFLGSVTGAVFDPGQVPPAPPRLGAFSATGALVVPRHPGSLTLLADGSVLVMGGAQYDSAANQKVVERYDPATGTFHRLGDLLVSRAGLSATALPDGKVLVYGGGGGYNTPDPVAELYDPATGTSTALTVQDWGRAGNRAVTLPDGRILIVGGQGGAQAMIYDPAAGTFQTGASISSGTCLDAALLPSGKVLLLRASAYGIGFTSIYDPGAGLVSDGPALHAQATYTSLVALGNGTVLALRDQGAEVYDPVANAFLPTDGLLHALDGVHPVRLSDGTVLLPQGSASTLPTQVFLPTLNQGLGGFIAGPLQLPLNTAFLQSLLLKDGRVLLVEAAGCQVYTP